MVSTRNLALKAAAPARRGDVPPVETTTPQPPSLTTRLGDADADGSGGTQEYERRRDERIRENMERMQRLGIVDLALKFRSSISGGSGSTAPKRPCNKTATATFSSAVLPWRSSRLQNVTPVSYSEIHVASKDEGPEKKIRIEGPVKEVYTDEHEKLLGTCETSWTLFVDGYSKDGVRIYDPVKGKTCHQCRQKTLGHRTNCSKCKILQGQFCGDCLYMRYGENVLEANKNLNWICPVCRGICNFSLCCTKKGWAPTGVLYKKILGLGFKSVAHFLIQTKCAQTSPELVSSHLISAKRSLPFTDEADQLEISGCDMNGVHWNEQMILFDGSKDKEIELSEYGPANNCGEHGNFPILDINKVSRKKQKEETESTVVVEPSTNITGRLKNDDGMFGHSANKKCNSNFDEYGKFPILDTGKISGKKQKKETESMVVVKPSTAIAGRPKNDDGMFRHSANKNCNSNFDEYGKFPILDTSKISGKKQKKETESTVVVKSSTDIAGRLKNDDGMFRHGADNNCNDNADRQIILLDLGNDSQRFCNQLKDAECIGNRKAKNLDNGSPTLESSGKTRKKHQTKMWLTVSAKPNSEFIAGRLTSRCVEHNDLGNDSQQFCNQLKDAACIGNLGTKNLDKHDSSPTLESAGKTRKKHPAKMWSTLFVKPNSESIAGRLRSRGIEHNDSQFSGERETLGHDEYINRTTLESNKELDPITVPTGRQRTHSIGKDSGCEGRNNSIIESNSLHKDSSCKSRQNISNKKLENKDNGENDFALLVQPSIDCIAGRLRSRISSYDNGKVNTKYDHAYGCIRKQRKA